MSSLSKKDRVSLCLFPNPPSRLRHPFCSPAMSRSHAHPLDRLARTGRPLGSILNAASAQTTNSFRINTCTEARNC